MLGSRPLVFLVFQFGRRRRGRLNDFLTGPFILDNYRKRNAAAPLSSAIPSNVKRQTKVAGRIDAAEGGFMDRTAAEKLGPPNFQG